MGNDTFTLTIDRTPHATKNQAIADVAAITRRLQAAGPETVTFEDLAATIEAGGTICCGCYQPSARGWGEFVGMQLLALDFDNPLELSPEAALRRCEELHLEPLLFYFTLSMTASYPKYRIIFDMGEFVTDAEAAHTALRELLGVFSEADQQCSNLNRLFFGGSKVLDCRGGVF